MFGEGSGRRLVRTAALAVPCLLVAGAVAWAAAPEKGKHYKGAVTTDSYDTVSFNVSSDGKKVEKLKMVVPSKCETGAFKTPAAQSAKISTKGTFKKTFGLTAAAGGSAGSETITGTFEAGGKEKGKMMTHATGSLSGCSITVSYTTKAS